MFEGKQTRIMALGLDITLPPMWFQYRWQHDPEPDRVWCWDVTMAQDIQQALKLTRPDLYAQAVQSYPIEFFLEPLAGNTVNVEYARSLRPERLAVPLIGVCLPMPIMDGLSRVGVVIDGCHRLFRKHELGHTEVQVLHLPDEIEEVIRFPDDKVQALKTLGLLE